MIADPKEVAPVPRPSIRLDVPLAAPVRLLSGRRKVALAWAVVGIPLLWGVWITLTKALALL